MQNVSVCDTYIEPGYDSSKQAKWIMLNPWNMSLMKDIQMCSRDGASGISGERNEIAWLAERDRLTHSAFGGRRSKVVGTCRHELIPRITFPSTVLEYAFLSLLINFIILTRLDSNGNTKSCFRRGCTCLYDFIHAGKDTLRFPPS